jgi:hypothetical protein
MTGRRRFESKPAPAPYWTHFEEEEIAEFNRLARLAKEQTQESRQKKVITAGAVIMVLIAIAATFFGNSETLWGKAPHPPPSKQLIDGTTYVEAASKFDLHRSKATEDIDVVLSIDVGLLEWSSKLVQRNHQPNAETYVVLDLPTASAELTFFTNGSVKIGGSNFSSDAVRVTDIMRLIGRSCNEASVQEIKGWLPYKLVISSGSGFTPCVGGEKESALMVQFEVGTQRVQRKRPEELVALMLASTIHAAEERLGRNIKDVLISIPADYGYRQRVAVIEAFKIASADSNIRIDRSGKPTISKPNFSRLKVKELKQLLSERQLECNGCSAKSDFVTMLEQAWKPPGAPQLALLRLANSNSVAAYAVRNLLLDRDGDGDTDVVIFSVGESASLVTVGEEGAIDVQATVAIEAPDLTLRLNDFLMDQFDSQHCKNAGGCFTSKELQQRKVQGKSFDAGAAKECCIRAAPRMVKQKLREAVETMETQLSTGNSSESVDIHLESIHNDHDLGPLTLEKEKLDRQLLVDALRAISGMLKSHSLPLSLKDVDDFVAIGDTATLRQLHAELKWSPEDIKASHANFDSVDLSSLVATGAAAYAAVLTSMSDERFSVLEVSTASYTFVGSQATNRFGKSSAVSKRWVALPHNSKEIELEIPESIIKSGKLAIPVFENTRGDATVDAAHCGYKMQKCIHVGAYFRSP